MKHLISASFGAVLGLVLGGLPARSEIRGVREELRALERRDCGVGRGLATMFQGGPMVARAETARSEPPETAPATPRTAEPDDPPWVHEEEGSARLEAPRREIEMAREVLEARRVQARAALLEEANPEPAQLATFDAAIAEMNEDLRDLARIFVDDLARREEEPSRRELMTFAADTLDVLLSAGEKMSGVLDEEQRAAVTEESIDPLSYVDPAIADLLSELDR